MDAEVILIPDMLPRLRIGERVYQLRWQGYSRPTAWELDVPRSRAPLSDFEQAMLTAQWEQLAGKSIPVYIRDTVEAYSQNKENQA